jgi:hypothetical protein
MDNDINMLYNRQSIPESLKIKILEEQTNKCANTPTSKIKNMNGYKCDLYKYNDGSFPIKQNNKPMCNFDHIIPVQLGGTNDEYNIHALCLPCHEWKTMNDNNETRKYKKIIDTNKRLQEENDELKEQLDHIQSKYFNIDQVYNIINEHYVSIKKYDNQTNRINEYEENIEFMKNVLNKYNIIEYIKKYDNKLN